MTSEPKALSADPVPAPQIGP
ncbi:MAG: hypothetical protein V7632_4744, partial [Bradyrhizobium sp.]